MAGNVCCIINFAAHYKAEIYLKMEAELDADFFFGNATAAKVKKIDYAKFSKKPKELKYIRLFSNFNILYGSVKLSFKKYRYYIITGEPFCISSWIVLLFNRLMGKQSFLWTHGWYGDEGIFKELIKIAYFRLATGVLLYGNYARDLMIKKGFVNDRLHLIYNSLSYSVQFDIRKSLKKTAIYHDKFSNDLPVVIFIGRLQKQKKIGQLFSALQKSISNNEQLFNICLIGTGNDQVFLEGLVKEYDIEQYVWFYGECYDELIISNLIYNADLCVSPGEVGLTAIHAMSYGTPVITHNDFVHQGPEFECIEEEKTGFFFQKDDVNSLASSIQYWFKMHPYKSLEIINLCYSVIDKKYNPEYQINLLKSLIK